MWRECVEVGMKRGMEKERCEPLFFFGDRQPDRLPNGCGESRQVRIPTYLPTYRIGGILFICNPF